MRFFSIQLESRDNFDIIRIIFKAIFADFLSLTAMVISSAYKTIFTILSSIEMPLICSFSRIADAGSSIPRMNKLAWRQRVALFDPPFDFKVGRTYSAIYHTAFRTVIQNLNPFNKG